MSISFQRILYSSFIEIYKLLSRKKKEQLIGCYGIALQCKLKIKDLIRSLSANQIAEIFVVTCCCLLQHNNSLMKGDSIGVKVAPLSTKFMGKLKLDRKYLAEEGATIYCKVTPPPPRKCAGP